MTWAWCMVGLGQELAIGELHVPVSVHPSSFFPALVGPEQTLTLACMSHCIRKRGWTTGLTDICI
jgi:hypothetical protein